MGNRHIRPQGVWDAVPRGCGGAALDMDVLHSAQVNFGDTSVPREEILRRI